jgi:hypothetical protein
MSVVLDSQQAQAIDSDFAPTFFSFFFSIPRQNSTKGKDSTQHKTSPQRKLTFQRTNERRKSELDGEYSCVFVFSTQMEMVSPMTARTLDSYDKLLEPTVRVPLVSSQLLILVLLEFSELPRAPMKMPKMEIPPPASTVSL